VEAWLAGDADAAAAVAEAGVVDELFASSTAGVTADSTDCVPFRFDIGGGSCTFASASGPGTLTVSDRDGRFVVIGVDRG
ncbi:MAG TPA: hypothetical protein PKA98_00830, partial [Acidimicrobiales bacterium]|nr:hypothetical protein [Acidimicrobiales bacterium]